MCSTIERMELYAWPAYSMNPGLKNGLSKTFKSVIIQVLTAVMRVKAHIPKRFGFMLL